MSSLYRGTIFRAGRLLGSRVLKSGHLVAIMSVILSFATSARAQDRSFSPQIFHPAPGPDEFVTVEAARPLGHKAFGLGLFFNYARNPFSIYRYDTTSNAPGPVLANVISNLVGADLWAGFGLWNRLQVAVLLPMTLYQTGDDFTSPNPPPKGTTVRAGNGFALGDPRLYLKLHLYGHRSGFQISVSHWLAVPVGSDDQFGGGKHFTGFSGEPRVLLGWEAERFRIGLELGYIWRVEEAQFFSTIVGNELTYGGAAAVDVIKRRLTLVLEVYGLHDFASDQNGSTGSRGLSTNVSPLEIDLSAKIGLIPGLALTAGVGNGIITGLGSPQPRAFLGLVYAPDNRDRDRDGISDAVDACPDIPEDRDGFQDKDGCPDPDNDGDTILDRDDKCPNEAEDFDEFEDQDGCPDRDNDKDGIPDATDHCPNETEDGKAPLPTDGCPLSSTDSDGDGINDAVDKCPNDPEDQDNFEDQDGCPDPDNDGDSVPDEYDDCPDQPEDVDGFNDEDGCPDPENDKGGRGAKRAQ
jgi:OOP family OmpA-OmpF porin